MCQHVDAGASKAASRNDLPQSNRAATLKEHLAPISGLRVLACIALTGFHIFFFRPHLDWESLYESLHRSWLVHLLMQSWFGLDILFPLTAFFAALSLIPALTKPGASVTQVVLQYWWKRAVRIIPAYYVSIALFALMLREMQSMDPKLPQAPMANFYQLHTGCPDALWATAGFFSHWLPLGGCGAYLWSQGVMAHFWVLAPLLAAALLPQLPGFRRRVIWAAGAVIGMSTAYRAWNAARYNIKLPLPFLGGPDLDQVFAQLEYYLQRFHMALAPRVGSMAMGTLLALPLTSVGNSHSAPKGGAPSSGFTRPMNGSLSTRSAASLGALLSAAVLYFGIYRPVVFGAPNTATWPTFVSLPYLATMLQGGVAVSSATACLMYAFMTKAGPLGRAGHWLLSADICQKLEPYCYSAYLYQFQARFLLWRFVLPASISQSAHNTTGLAIEVVACLVVGFALAFLSFHLVEAPAQRLLLQWTPFARKPKHVSTD